MSIVLIGLQKNPYETIAEKNKRIEMLSNKFKKYTNEILNN